METRAPLASDRGTHTWHAHPRQARLLGITIVLVPVAVAAASGLVVASFLWKPSSVFGALVWWSIVLTCSLLCSAASETLVNKLLPLKALLALSLVFPDQTPSRFKTALTAGSTRQLERLTTPARGGPVVRGAAEAELVLAMVGELNGHDRRTRGHSERVRAFAELLGEQLKVAPTDREKLRWAALLHDLGKLEVSAEVLNKHGRPDAREWQILQRHPEYGARRARTLHDWLGHWILGVQQHHERWDGGGYPRGLAGSEIDLSGRIIAVADAFETMTAVRSYKKAMPAEAARQELADNAGAHFDPDVVRAFLQISVGDLRKAIGPFAWMIETPLLRDRPAEVLTVAAKGVAALATVIAVFLLGGHRPSQAEPAPVPVASTVSTTTTTTTSATTATTTAIGPDAVIDHPDPTVPPTVAVTTTTTPSSTTTSAPSTTSTTPPRPVAVAPTPHDDSLVLDAGTSASVDVLANDDAGSAPLAPATLTVTRVPGAGTASVDGSSVRYATTDGFAGTDSFTYRVCDVNGGCGTATVTVTVQPVPVPVADRATTTEATPVTIGVTGNDSPGAGSFDLTSLAVTVAPAHGTTTVQPDGTIDYTPTLGYAGGDAFTHQVCDTGGGGCGQATVNLQALGQSVPTVTADSATTNEANAVTVNVLGNDSGGTASTLTVTSPPTHGTASVVTGNQVSYTPNTGFTGTDKFVYQVCNSNVCGTATVSITVNAVAPVAADDSATVPSTGTVAIDVLANDADAGGDLDHSSVVVVTPPVVGYVRVNPDGSIRYQPVHDALGVYTFTYQIKDVHGATDTATATVTVT